RVEERIASRGGPQFAYRLRGTASPEQSSIQPAFRLQLPTDAVTLERGGQVKLKISAQRLGDFQDEIALEFRNLPAGITATGTQIGKNRSDAQITLQAAADAAVQVAAVQVIGSVQSADEGSAV